MGEMRLVLCVAILVGGCRGKSASEVVGNSAESPSASAEPMPSPPRLPQLSEYGIKMVGADDQVHAAVFSPDNTLVAAAADESVQVWQWNDRKTIRETPREFSTDVVAFDDNETLLIGAPFTRAVADLSLMHWQFRSQPSPKRAKAQAPPPCPEDNFLDVAMHAAEKFAVSACTNLSKNRMQANQLVIVDLEGTEAPRTYPVQLSDLPFPPLVRERAKYNDAKRWLDLEHPRVSPTGDAVAFIVSLGVQAEGSNLALGAALAVFELHGERAGALRYARLFPTYIQTNVARVWWSSDDTVFVTDPTTTAPNDTDLRICGLHFDAEGHFVAAVPLAKSYQSNPSLAFLRHHQRLLLVSENVVALLDARTGEALASVPVDFGLVLGVTVSADESRALIRDENAVRQWSLVDEGD